MLIKRKFPAIYREFSFFSIVFAQKAFCRYLIIELIQFIGITTSQMEFLKSTPLYIKPYSHSMLLFDLQADGKVYWQLMLFNDIIAINKF
jgi:hypothetical protein